MRRLVGRNVNRIRVKNGLTQRLFADVSGATQQYISGLPGRRTPTVVAMFERAQAVRVSHVALVAPDDGAQDVGV